MKPHGDVAAMRSSTIALTLGLLASPVALFANPQSQEMSNGLLELVQSTTQTTIPSSQTAPDQSINGRPLLDAPVPGPPPGIAPVDRVAGPGSRDLVAGPVNSTPFSAAPTSNLQGGSQAAPNGAPGGFVTPALGR